MPTSFCHTIQLHCKYTYVILYLGGTDNIMNTTSGLQTAKGKQKAHSPTPIEKGKLQFIFLERWVMSVFPETRTFSAFYVATIVCNCICMNGRYFTTIIQITMIIAFKGKI